MKSFLTAVGLLCLLPLTHAEDWPEFRGPSGQGHSVSANVPLTWNENENVAWKTPLAGLGWSSPAIVGGRIWVTTALDDGAALKLLALDASSGNVELDVTVFEMEDPGRIHRKNSHASPTPLIDGDRVYVHFGTHGTACVSTEGEVLWKNVLKYNHRHGPGGSPIVVDDLLILSCDGTDIQFAVALDKHTGEERWRSSRDGSMAYTTPLLIEVEGKRQVVSPCGEWVVAYDPTTGDEIWKVRYPEGYSNVPRPVYGHGLVFVVSGYNTPSLYAIDPTGSGDVTETHVAWKLDRAVPHNPSPLIVDDGLYIVSDRGIATCLVPETGEVLWQSRVGGQFSASPLYAGGRIYLTDEEGLTTVIAPNEKKYEVLAENPVAERVQASLAVYDDSLFLRTETALYRIGK